MFSNHSDFNKSSFFEALEDRVLFDGVPDAAFILPQVDAAETIPAQMQSVHQADSDSSKELILIDAGVHGGEQLLDEVLQNRPDSAFEVRFINGDENGVSQISELLAQADGKYDAIHIVSHGDEGEVNLGNSKLTSDNLGRYATELAGWANALTEDADILFYGCELAGNAEGQQFIETISAITGADVAASGDLTGSEELGGDWDLEIQVGDVAASSILLAENWSGTLGQIALVDLTFDSSNPDDAGTTTDTLTADPWVNGSEGTSLGVFGGTSTPPNANFDNGYAEVTAAQGETGHKWGFDGAINNSAANSVAPDSVSFDYEVLGHNGEANLLFELGTFSLDIPLPSTSGEAGDQSVNFDATVNGEVGSGTVTLDFANNWLTVTHDGHTTFTTDLNTNLTLETGANALSLLASTAADTDVGFDANSNSTGGPDAYYRIDNFKISVLDTDSDGVADTDDIDDDNDGILDVVEVPPITSVVSVDFENYDTSQSGGGVFDRFAQYFPTGTTPLENFRGTAGFFLNNSFGPSNPGSTGFSGLHGADFHDSGDGEAILISLNSDTQLVQGNEYEISLLSYMIQVAKYRNPGTIEIFGVEVGATATPSGAITNPAEIEAMPGVTHLGRSAVVDSTTEWNEFTISFAADANYDRLILMPRGTGYDPDGNILGGGSEPTDGRGSSFLAIDSIQINESASGDTDADGIDNHLDIDSDNDGITDNVEAQSTANYIAPSGVGGTAAFLDANRDGLDDRYDDQTGADGQNANGSYTHTGTGLTPVDTDSDGTADVLDLDSDGDGAQDAAERGTSGPLVAQTGVTSDATTDTDGDGLLDVFEGGNVDDGFDVNDENRDAFSIALADSDNDLDADGTNAIALNIDSDFREALDTDGDNVHDEADIDDDNDGILDVAETNSYQIVTLPDNSTIGAFGIHQNNVAEYTDPSLSFEEQVGVKYRFNLGASTGTGVPDFNTDYFSTDLIDGVLGSGITEGFISSSAFNPRTVNDAHLDPFANDHFVQVSFETLATFPAGTDGLALNSLRVNNANVNGGGTVPITIQISSDNFESSIDVLSNHILVDQQVVNFDDAVVLEEGQTYQIRIYYLDEVTTGFDDDWAFGFQTFDPTNAAVQTPVISGLERDADADGIADHLDIDSDNDGITDNVEAQSTANYIAPSGVGGTAAFVDVNRDGLDDRYDDTQAGVGSSAGGAPHTGLGLTPVDTDSDGTADVLDLDSEGDGVEDAAERGTTGPLVAQTGVTSDATTDTDGDGLLDVFEGGNVDDGFDVNDENRDATSIALADSDNDLDADGTNVIALDIDSDFREALDTDGDNVHDAVDIDDDNDGVIDLLESRSANTLNYTFDPRLVRDRVTADALFRDMVFDGTYTLDFDEPIAIQIITHHGDNTQPNDGTLTLNGVSQAVSHDANELIALTHRPDVTSTYTLSLTGTLPLNALEIQDLEGNTLAAFDFGRDDGTTTSPVEPGFTGINFTGDQNNPVTINGSLAIAAEEFDTDNDGVFNRLDIDSDNDGITDNIEAQTTLGYAAPSGDDDDRDGLDDAYDADSNDIDAVISLGLSPVDTDSDNVIDLVDTDSDNDGVLDIAERGDGQPTSATSPADDDEDGLLDIFEHGTIDDGFVANDGVDPATDLADSDNDLFLNVPGTHDVDFRDGVVNPDTDNDGILDVLDVDDDNDGILDTREKPFVASTSVLGSAAGASVNGNTVTQTHNGITFTITHNGGVNTLFGANGVQYNGGADASMVDFTITASQPVDSIVLSIGDFDQFIESLTNFSVPPVQVDGLVGPFEVVGSGSQLTLQSTVENNDGNVHFQGLNGATEITFTLQRQPGFGVFFNGIGQSEFATADHDTDSDGIVDRLDIDSDNDGITDNVEAQTTADYIAPSGLGGTAAFVDENMDGLDDRYDQRGNVTSTTTAAAIGDGDGLIPVDTDGLNGVADGIADYVDLDADNDGLEDAAERGTAGPLVAQTGVTSDATTDTDGDGLLDVFEGSNVDDGFDVNDENRDAFSIALADTDGDLNGGDGTGAIALDIDSDFREALDTDGDNVRDEIDIDDDNDGILDVIEDGLSQVPVLFGSHQANETYDLANGIAVTQNLIGNGIFTGIGNASNDNGAIALASNDGVTLSFDEPVIITILPALDVNPPNFGTSSGIDERLVVQVDNDSAFSLSTPSPETLLSDGTGANTSTNPYTGQNAAILRSGNNLGGWSVTTSPTTTFSMTLIDGNTVGDVRILIERAFAPDSDNDGVTDRLDIDSDNDGITDNVEAQSTANYVAPSGLAFLDANRDGLDDRYDSNENSLAGSEGTNANGMFTHAGTGLTPVDTDSDGTADVLDLDSDGDGAQDAAERGTAGPLVAQTGVTSDATTDTDGDGLLDVFEGSNVDDGFDVNDENRDATSIALADSDNDLDADGINAIALDIDSDFREALDTDSDNVRDEIDIDDDNDGILDTTELVNPPATPLDLTNINDPGDSFAAGVPLIIESSITGVMAAGDLDGNLVLSQDATLEGTSFTITFNSPTQLILSAPTTSVGANFNLGDQWTLSAADATFTVSDAGGTLDVADGTVANETLDFTATAGSGAWTITTSHLSSLTLTFDPSTAGDSAINIFTGEVDLDTDQDGIVDRLDIDSDNDGITDNIEAQTTAGYIAPSGVGGAFVDINRDGLDDNYEVASGTDGFNFDGIGLNPVDTDLSLPLFDGIEDFRDTDSDDDGISDAVEAGHGVSQTAIDTSVDTDGDGLKDVVEGSNINDGFVVNDENVDVNGDFTLDDTDGDVEVGRANADPLNVDYDFREARDTDGDNVHDLQDIDDDNDGILDVDEGAANILTPFALSQTSIDLSEGGISNRVTISSPSGGLIDASFLTFQFAEDESVGTVYQLAFDEPVPGVQLAFSSINDDAPIGNFTVVYDDGTSASNLDFTLDQLPLITNDLSGNQLVKTTINGLNAVTDGQPGNGFGIGETGSGLVTLLGLAPNRQVSSVSWELLGQTSQPNGPLGNVMPVVTLNADHDQDGVFDHLDIDSDNDGITDNVEAQSTADYISPSGLGGTAGFVDTNKDGLDDAFDSGVGVANLGATTGHTGIGLTPVDTDNDGTADVVDLDSDDDAAEDAAERGTTGPLTAQTGVTSNASTDADGDGLLDAFEGSDTDDGFDVNDENRNSLSIALADSDGDLNGGDGMGAIALDMDSDFREALDTDGDNVHDEIDIDDDNDGILDVVESVVTGDYFNLTSFYTYNYGPFYGYGGGTIAGQSFSISGNGFSTNSVVNDSSNELVGSQFSVVPPGGLGDVLAPNSQNDGTSFEIRFDDPIHNLVLLIKDLDATYSFSEPFTVENLPSTTLAVNANGELFSSVFDAADASTQNQGTGTVAFSGPVSSLTITKVSGPADEWSFGFAQLQFTDTDSDGDSVVDRLDIDSDNDGITDNVEAQSTVNYIAPSGVGGTAAFVDSNRDGLDDRYDSNENSLAGSEGTNANGMFTHAGTGLTPVDTDSDGTADVLDLDSDNDGAQDAAERGTTGPLVAQTGVTSDATTDTDGDGLLDVFEGGNVDDGFDVNDENRDAFSIALADSDNDLDADGINAIALDIDSDFREALDTDGDNVRDEIDIDDDNDGILDTVERGPATPASVDWDTDSSADGNVSGQLVGTDGNSFGAVSLTSSFVGANEGISFGFNWAALAGTNDVPGVGSITSESAVAGVNNPDTPPDVTILNHLSLPVAVTNPILLFSFAEDLTYDFSLTTTAGIQVIDAPPGVTVTVSGGLVSFTGFANPNQVENAFAIQLTGEYTDIRFTGNSTHTGGATSSSTQGVTLLGDVLSLPDNDADGIADHLDIDSDNDGITDNVEAQSTANYIAPSGVGGTAAFVDANRDGLDDRYDDTQAGVGSNADGVTHTGLGLTPVDTDSTLSDADGVADYLDLDSDNDGIEDAAERGTSGPPVAQTGVPSNVATDTDGDGLLDAFEGGNTNDGSDVNDENRDAFSIALADSDNDTAIDGSDAVPLLADLDFRDVFNSSPTLDLNGTNSGTDNVELFVEDQFTLLLKPDGTVGDTEDNITAVDIVVTLPTDNDGADEFLRTAPGNPTLSINLGTGVVDAPGPLTFGSTTFDVTYANDVVSIRNASGSANSMSVDDLQAFLRTLGYENVNQNNTSGQRLFRFEVTDRDFTAVATTTATVNRVNDAPIVTVSSIGDGTVVSAGETPNAIAVHTEDGPAVFSVFNLLSQLDIADVEQNSFGIGITSADESNGVWQYFRTDIAGFEWTDFQLGDPDNLDAEPVPDGEALLLDYETQLRFVPNDGFGGTAGIEFRVWDGTEGVASNPPSTITDNSGGTPPSDKSSLSATAFSALVSPDKDGDGVGDFEDADADGDGILDTYEQVVSEGASGAYTWTHNLEGGASTAGIHNEFGPGAEHAVASSTDAFLGDGFTELQLNGNPASGGNGMPFEFYIDGTTSATLDDARTNNQYVEMAFTTLEDFAGSVMTLTQFNHGTQSTGEGSNNFADFDLAVEVSTDGFATAGELLLEDFRIDRDNSSYNFRAGPELNYELQEGTTYTFRVYLYNDNGEGVNGSNGQVDQIGRVTFDDSQFVISETSVTDIDTDNDGIPDHCDLDSDNDGISDLVESGNQTLIDADTNGDGVVTGEEANTAGLVDDDGDGVWDDTEMTPVDTDEDGIADYLDLDSDDDGIPDAVEAQATSGYQTPAIGSDADGDGVVDTFDDPAVEHGGAFTPPVDTDQDNTPDYLDTDSDDDGTSDTDESGLTLTGNDDNGDGLDDGVAPIVAGVLPYADTDGVVSDPSSDLDNLDSDDSDVDFRSINLEAIDDLPVTNEETSITLDPLANDESNVGIVSMEIQNVPDAATEGTLTYVSDVTGVTLAVMSGDVLTPAESATLIFTPVMDFAGTLPSIGYVVTDEEGQISGATIDITVTPTPDVLDDPIVTNEDTPVSINPLANDDPGAGVATVTIDSVPVTAAGSLTYIDETTGLPVAVMAGATLSPAEAATLEFTPTTDFNGTVSPIEYTLTDVNGEESSAEILLEVTPTPDATEDPITVNEDTPVSINPLANDDAGAGVDSVTIDSVPETAAGSLTYIDDTTGLPVAVMAGAALSPAEAATLEFTPTTDFSGTVSPIEYTLTDVNGEESSAEILIEVTPTPDAMEDPITINEDTPASINPLANDDPGAGIDSVTIDSVPETAAGSLTYIDDTTGLPVAVMAGATLSPAEAATLEFTPTTDFSGTVSPIEYTLTDVNGEESSAEILLEVTPTPDATEDPITVNEDTPVSINPLANDDAGAGIDSVTINNVPDGVTEGAFTYTDDTTGLPVTIAAGDVLSPTEAASIQFTPIADFHGVIATVTYTATDINGETSDANIDISVTPTPDAASDTYSSNEDTPVALDPLSNDDLGAGVDTVGILNVPDPTAQGTLTYIDDLTGNTLTATAGTVLSPAESMSLSFTPVADFSGSVTTIGYEVTGVNGETSQAVLDISFTPTPDVLDDPIVTNEDTPVSINPLANDDPGAGVATVTIDSVPETAAGSLTYIDETTGLPVAVMAGATLSPAEAATLEFTPTTDFNGTVSPIEYTLTDVNGEESSAEILLEVTPTPDATEDPITVNEDTPVSINPLANDDAGAGVDAVTINNIPDPTQAELTYVDPVGNTVVVTPGDMLTPEQAATLTFIPAEGFNGTVLPITYTVTDINGETSDANISITVEPTPDAVNDVNTTTANTPVQGNVIDNDLYDPSKTITVTEVNGIPIGNGPIETDFGTVLINPDGTYTYTSSSENAGVDTFTYTITDQFGNESEATVTVDVANLGIAKSVVGEPVLTERGNFVATYQVVIENTGTVDLANLSLLEDLSGQFGAAFVGARNLSIVTGTSNPASNIAVDSGVWNGSTIAELLDDSNSNILAVGDSFIIQFDVEVNPREVAAPLGSQIVGSGTAVDMNGVPILNSNDTQVVAEDVSDDGTDPTGTNSSQPDDQGTSNDPTLFDPPEVPLSQITGTVFQDNNSDGNQDPGEGGIAGVEVTLTGTDIFGNLVETTVLTDVNGNYFFDELNAGTYTITETQPEDFDDGIDSGAPEFTVGNDQFSNIQLGFGETLSNGNFAELVPDDSSIASGNPPQLPRLAPLTSNLISNLINSFLGSPGPIYSGVSINSNANPLTLDGGRALTGGYTESGDGWGEEIYEPSGQQIESRDNSMHSPVNVESECSNEDALPVDGETGMLPVDMEGAEANPVEGEKASDSIGDPAERNASDPDDSNVLEVSFLRRFMNWLNS